MLLTHLGEHWIPIHALFETIYMLTDTGFWLIRLSGMHHHISLRMQKSRCIFQLPEIVGHNEVAGLTAVVFHRYQNVWLQSDNSRWIQPTVMRHCLHGQCCFCHQDHDRPCQQGCTWLASAEQQQLHNHSEGSKARWWSVVSPKWWPDLHCPCSLRILSH